MNVEQEHIYILTTNVSRVRSARVTLSDGHFLSLDGEKASNLYARIHTDLDTLEGISRQQLRGALAKQVKA